LKNTFCFIKGNQLICSEHIGDLENAEVYHHYIKSIEHLRGLFEAQPKVIACDLHPAYFSSQYARTWHGLPAREDTAKMAVPRVIEVQHHWAHIASVIAEHGIEEPVIGLACDGTGYGTDGAIWGCECLIATLDDFERFSHLAYYPLAGGDAASKEPIRPLLGLLIQAYGNEFDLKSQQWLLGKIEPDYARQEIICEQIRKKINTVATSSLGRVFDAVAAMLGLGIYNHFEAQLPMALEAIADVNCDQQYDFEFAGQSMLDLGLMIRQIATDIRENKEPAVISAKFHNTVANALLAMAKQARERTNHNIAAFSGGVFCNNFLTERLIRLLNKNGFKVLYNSNFPTNDGCISVGQAAIAAKRATSGY
jgi:hydrogenase maturation protein HypF